MLLLARVLLACFREESIDVVWGVRVIQIRDTKLAICRSSFVFQNQDWSKNNSREIALGIRLIWSGAIGRG